MASFDKSRSSLLFGSFLLLIMGTGLLRSLAQTGTEPRKPAVRASKELTKLSFNETIQPILSENCYACHVPDPGARKAKLSAPVHMFGHVFSRQPLPGGGSICEAMRGDLFV